MSKTTTTELILIKTNTTESISPNPPKPSVTDMPNLTEPKAAETPSPQTKKKIPGTADTVMSNGVESHDAESEEMNGTEEDGQTETGERVTAPIEEGEEEGEEGEEGEEVVPVGSVDSQGQVIDKSGNVVGKVEGDVPEGSLVDTEGDVLDAEGNVIGKADVEGAAKEAEGAAGEAKEGAEGAAGEAKEGVEGAAGETKEGVEKPELAAPFGVQDNGEVTNAAGVPIGKLAEGDPQDLVGRSIKEIDDEGHLKAESGSTIGKVELNPEVHDKGEEAAGELSDKAPTEQGEAAGEVGDKAPTEQGEAAGELDEKAPTEQGAAGELGDKAPTEQGEVAGELGDKAPTEQGEAVGELGEKAPEGEEATGELEKAKPELDLSILDGMKVNKLGKIVKEDVSANFPNNTLSSISPTAAPRTEFANICFVTGNTDRPTSRR